MNSVYQDIFKAIHEGKWLSIEYKNKSEQITKYWIGIKNLNVRNKTLAVEGMHLAEHTIQRFDYIYIDSIISSSVIEGTYYEVNQNLVEDIYLNPHKYTSLFENVANLKILNYLEDCNRMDTTPYRSDFELVRYLDGASLNTDSYDLSTEQFNKIVSNFQYKATNGKSSYEQRIQQLGMNILSIYTPKGWYVLAFRKLEFDVKNRCLTMESEITVCTEFVIDGVKESIRKFLDANEYELLENFETNQEAIKDCIQKHLETKSYVDDMPYIIGIAMDLTIDLHKEYAAIINMYGRENVPIPIKGFFGELLARPVRTKAYPLCLVNRRVNLDQLLAINNAMKYPLAYIQGPPGTGKTNTIINTISTAFFNEKTVLFSSYNNHPIDAVFDKLTKMTYRGRRIPFPIIRVGNQEKVKEALQYLKAIYKSTKSIQIFDKTLDKKKDDRTERVKRLSDMLKQYEEVLDLKERNETLTRMLDYNDGHMTSIQMLPFQADLSGQAEKVAERIKSEDTIQETDALNLLTEDEDELQKYLFYTSAKYIKRIDEPKNEDLRLIMEMGDIEKGAEEFSKYLSKPENLKKFLRIFPMVVTTCISAHKLGKPECYFDMVVMDEASQCNTAISLVPIIRGQSLMLVGDPQQLNPVILLNAVVNEKLKKKYKITKEYDYCTNSIYKTYLACDSVSDEVLLRYHYRCNKKIIEFNNRKFYNSKLNIRSTSKEAEPLLYLDVSGSTTGYKNTAPYEVEQIVEYAKVNKEKSIGVITPFVNQKKEVEMQLKRNNLSNVTCGTVHAFQGDEKDVVLFSTAITDKTNRGTYEWLKNNKELINVATSRAKDKLIVLSNLKELERLHLNNDDDDLYELVQYVRQNGQSHVTAKETNSRALGVKPFSTQTEEAFLLNLNHAMENIWFSQNRFVVEKEVGIAHVFQENLNYSDLFYSGRFDFVVYEKHRDAKIPVLAIELDGKEHFSDEVVKNRDRKKEQICQEHNFQLIRIENSYARRYNHIKDILMTYFSRAR